MKDSSQHRKMPDLFGTLARGAVFSSCRTWRYTLTRTWDMTAPPAMFIGLNSCTADEVNNDPTVRRCLGFAKQWGYGGLIMTNIFAYRATDPRVMKAAEDPVGPENDVWLKKMGEEAAIVVADWGVHGVFGERGAQVRKLIPGLHCLGVTQEGHPRHPLYLRGDCFPEVLDEGMSQRWSSVTHWRLP